MLSMVDSAELAFDLLNCLDPWFPLKIGIVIPGSATLLDGSLTIEDNV